VVLNWILVTWPLAFFAWKAISSKNAHAYFLVGLYIYPLLMITAMTSGPYAIPGVTIPLETGNLLRISIHLFVFVILAMSVVSRRAQLPLLKVRFLWWPTIAIVGMILSIMVNLSYSNEVFRVLVTFLVVLNVFLLIPMIPEFDENYIRSYIVSAILVAFVFGSISSYTIWRYGFWPEWSFRLGRPLNPLVLSLLATVAFISSFIVKTSWIIRIFLLVFIILAASRMDTAIVIFFSILLAMGVRTEKIGSRIGLSLALFASGIIVLSLYEWYRVYLASNLSPYARSSILGVREYIWPLGLEVIKDSPWFGVGGRAYLERVELVETLGHTQRVHNMILELAMSYGIPVSIFAYAVYITIFKNVLKSCRIQGLFSSRITLSTFVLALVLLTHSLFSTLSWTNLGDGTVLLILSLIIPLTSYQADVKPKTASNFYRRHPNAPRKI
jgi:O-antigen ligase